MNDSMLACPHCHAVFDAGELFGLQEENDLDGCPECGESVADAEWEQD